LQFYRVAVYLNRPSPVFEGRLTKWIVLWGVTLFIFFFLWIFQPFGLFPNFKVEPLEASAVFASITFVIIGGYVFFGFEYLSNRYGQKWTLGRHLIAIFLGVSLIGLCNGFYANAILNDAYIQSNGTADVFLRMYGYTHAVGLFPTILTLLIAEVRDRSFYEHQSEQIKKKGDTYILNENTIHAPIEIRGESASEKLTLSSDDFLFARASGNYVDVFYRKEGSIEKEVMRITLTSLMDQLKEGSKWIFQTHRSYVVNLVLVVNVEGNAQGYTLTLEDTEEKVPVSRGKIQLFNELMNDI